MPNDHNSDLPVAISIGEPAGIGADVLLRAVEWAKNKTIPPLPRFTVLADPVHLRQRAESLAIDVQIAEHGSDLKDGSDLELVPLRNSFRAPSGTLNNRDAPGILEAIDRSVELIRDK